MDRDKDTGKFSPSGQNDHTDEPKKTAEKIANEIGKSEKYVRRAEQFAKALDTTDRTKQLVREEKY